MTTTVRRKVERLQDKISELSNALSDLEYEVGELLESKQDISLDEQLTADVSGDEWTFTKREAVIAFDLLDQIGLNPRRRYSLVTVEEIRLAVERILR